MLSYLPLAHSFDRILEELALSVGGHVGYWRVRGSAELAAAAAPSLFVGLLPLL
jgi:long-subunit acyl-CoA synthetase (AMP-forming)